MYYDCTSRDFDIDTSTHKVVFNEIKVTLRLDIFKLQIVLLGAMNSFWKETSHYLQNNGQKSLGSQVRNIRHTSKS